MGGSMIRLLMFYVVGVALLTLPISALAADIPASAAVGPVPGTPGDGLNGSYWQLTPKQIDPTDDGLKNVGIPIMASEPATSTFLSTVIDYTGNDLTPLRPWLQVDGPSAVGGDPDVNNFDDGMVKLQGFMAVSSPGTQDFYMPSDDGSILTIGGVTVIDNDGGHGQPGPNPGGSATFSEAGLYPIELAYFNGDWTNDAGDHGGANLRLFSGTDDTGAIVATDILYTVPEPSSILLAGFGLATMIYLLRRKR